MNPNAEIYRTAERGTRAAKARHPAARALARMLDIVQELLTPSDPDPVTVQQRLASDLATRRPVDSATLASAQRLTGELRLRNLAHDARTGDAAAFDQLAEQALTDPAACRQWALAAHRLGRRHIRPEAYLLWKGYQGGTAR